MEGETKLAKVTGLGGVFLRSKNPKNLMAWYHDHLGIEPANDFDGSVFIWSTDDKPDRIGSSVLGIFAQDTDYFGSENPPFMINFRVDNLTALLNSLRESGQTVDDKVEDMEGIGKFGWVIDPEGRRIELWEPATT